MVTEHLTWYVQIMARADESSTPDETTYIGKVFVGEPPPGDPTYFVMDRNVEEYERALRLDGQLISFPVSRIDRRQP